MKILFYISSMGGGGAQRVLWSLANYFCKINGHEVSVATNLSTSTAYSFDNRVKLYDIEKGISYKRGIWHFIRLLSSIRKVYKKASPDIVISFQRGMNGMVLLALLFAKAKIICSEHSHFLRKYGIVEDTLKSLLYWKADVITVLTRHDLKVCKHRKMKNAVYMPNPLQNIELSNKERKKQVLSVGVIDRWKIKGFDLLIQAWGKISSRHPDWKLSIAGKGNEQSMSFLNELVHSNNCVNVDFLGFRKDIAAVMQESAIFTLSSRFEGLPMALLEAMHAGCCCISFDCETGPNEIIRHKQNGMLIPAQDVEKLSEALDTVIVNKELREKYSAQASPSICRKYGENYVMNRWNILFSKL